MQPYSYTTFADNKFAMFERNEYYVVIAVVLAFALLGIVAVQTGMVPQKAEAAGCTPDSTGYNASKGRCFRG
jgi:hypothetical protein